jgi:hypothetical protein
LNQLENISGDILSISILQQPIQVSQVIMAFMRTQCLKIAQVYGECRSNLRILFPYPGMMAFTSFIGDKDQNTSLNQTLYPKIGLFLDFELSPLKVVITHCN